MRNRGGLLRGAERDAVHRRILRDARGAVKRRRLAPLIACVIAGGGLYVVADGAVVRLLAGDGP